MLHKQIWRIRSFTYYSLRAGSYSRYSFFPPTNFYLYQSLWFSDYYSIINLSCWPAEKCWAYFLHLFTQPPNSFTSEHWWWVLDDFIVAFATIAATFLSSPYPFDFLLASSLLVFSQQIAFIDNSCRSPQEFTPREHPALHLRSGPGMHPRDHPQSNFC